MYVCVRACVCVCSCEHCLVSNFIRFFLYPCDDFFRCDELLAKKCLKIG